jgi:outer membrane protein TolC
LPKAIEAVRLVQMGFDQGKFGITDLLATQKTLAEAQLACEEKRLAWHLACAELETFAPENAPVASVVGNPPVKP